MPSKKIIINGIVQGVGFRPFVYRAAVRYGITGTVRNDGQGVIIHAHGEADALTSFIDELRTSPPPLSAVRQFEVKDIEAESIPDTFAIMESKSGEKADVDVTLDTATCPDCLREMNDPKDRRHNHPFINCTQCGPRYTIIESLPYDRPATTMKDFPMCPACEQEYKNPADRRFHAQPVCCPNCGPQLSFLDGDGAVCEVEDPIQHVRQLLAEGKIIAVKGIGGFHLACRADREDAVLRLRQRKHRDEKPFAVMAADLDVIKGLAALSEKEAAMLSGVERPIVLVRKNEKNNQLPESIAPGVPTVGFMLPYTPIHHLLLKDAPYSVLVMTSGNRSSEPIIKDNDEAVKKLKDIADGFLVHNRDIHVRNDDSIVRMAASAPVLVRRARGFAPAPIHAGKNIDGMIATGGVLKSSIAVGRGETCYLSQYLGESDTLDIINVMEDSIRHLTRLLEVEPQSLITDLHPQSLGDTLAEALKLPLHKVQHHHAHAVSCMAENGIHEKTVSIVLDGTGYGTDGNIWGGEVLLADAAGFDRYAHFEYLPMPGGEAAVKNPARMALGAFYTAVGEDVLEAFSFMDEVEQSAVINMLNTNTNCINTSSAGRLFDVIAAFLRVCSHRNYEGQPAMMLEGCLQPDEKDPYPFPSAQKDGVRILQSTELLRHVFADWKKGTSPAVISARFHNAIVGGIVSIAEEIADQSCNRNVCLTGGCFQNLYLLEETVRLLKEKGMNPVLHRLVPANDGGIALGQAVIGGE